MYRFHAASFVRATRFKLPSLNRLQDGEGEKRGVKTACEKRGIHMINTKKRARQEGVVSALECLLTS